MKKQWLITCVLVMSVLAFAACGKKQESAAGEGDQTGAVQETEAEATEEVKEEVEDAALAGTDLLAGAENAGDAASDAIAMQADILADYTGEIDLNGSWQDEVSQRATMDIEQAGTGTCHILIHWAGSAKEAAIWEISGTYDEASGMLSYEDGHYSVHTWDDEDQETVSGEKLTKGTLMKEGDKLRWQDSEISEDAVFVKISE